MAASSGRRCHYEVLGVQRESSPEEIRSAYKKLALQLHPDKLIQSGLSHSDATAKFQELSHAYEVLSDPKERAWYDSHRSQILFSDPSSASDSFVPNLFSFFSSSAFSGYSSDSKKGFFRVYSDVFDRIYAAELDFARKLGLGAAAVKEAPAMGDLASPYAQAAAFYGYWLGFATVMDFCWADVWDAAAGVNRKSRRVMEEENKKARRKARREYNETVRGLAEFVKKRDKRVIDRAVKRSEEMEKRKEEERERRRRVERERLERAMEYEEPEWARVEEEEKEEEEDEGEERKDEFYCVACGKKFKSEKQWKNHERSKKHREKVAELREEIMEDEDEDEVEVGELGVDLRDGVWIGEDVVGASDDVDANEFEVDGANGMENFEEKGDDVDANEFEVDGANGMEKFEEEGDDVDANEFEKLEAEGEVDGANGLEKVGEKGDEEDGEGEGNVEDDIGVLEAMLGGRKNRKKAASSSRGQVEEESDEMEYNNRKSTRKSRRARKEKSGKNGGERDDIKKEEINGNDGSVMEATSHSFAENESNGEQKLDSVAENGKALNQRGDKKSIAKSDANSKSKNSSKGKKAKDKPKNTTSACEKCGEEFESKTKLHKHLSDTGHATLKYR